MTLYSMTSYYVTLHYTYRSLAAGGHLPRVRRLASLPGPPPKPRSFLQEAVCVCVYMYVCIYIYIYIHTYVVCIVMFACMYVCIYIYTYTERERERDVHTRIMSNARARLYLTRRSSLELQAERFVMHSVQKQEVTEKTPIRH